MIYHWSSLLLILSSLVSIHAQNVATPANIVCYQEVVATNGSYAQINASLSAWSQKMYQTLGLTGPIELQVGWARVPDRTGFENGCTGPYPNIADLFVHIQTTAAQYDSVSSQLESFIAANRQTSQPHIVCSARSIVTYLPGCGKVQSGGSPLNNGTGSGNSTTAPTEAPSNNGTNSNSTEAPTRGPSPTNAPSNSTNSTTVAPTEAPSNATTSAPTEAPSNSTDLSSSGSIGNSTSTGNSSSGSNSTSSSTGDSTFQVAAGGAADQSATGGITINGAESTSMAGAAIVVPCIMAMVSMFQQ